MTPTDTSTPTAQPTFAELLGTFTRIGFLSFGGPAGQIALMHKVLVDEKRWVAEDAFLRALNFCHLLPGPEAQQLATYIGWKLYGTRGGLACGVLFVIPGALVILALSILYGYAADLDWFAAIFLGVKAAVLAIVVQALLRIAGRALNAPLKRGLAVAAFLALALFNLPFPLVVLGAGVIGLAVAGARPDWLKLKTASRRGAEPGSRASAIRQSLSAGVTWGLIWAAPMAAVLLTLGSDHVLWEIGAFFSKLAVVTFGGAYAVLGYMVQEAVTTHHWLTAGEMADGLGLAETTPGPLIMVTQFVGYLAGLRAPEPFTPLWGAILGAGLTTWVTFAPCFLWIFVFAPWMERLEHARRLQGGLAAVTAAVVGVIANLTLWFTLHVLFTGVTRWRSGPIDTSLPDWATLEPRALGLALLAAALLFGLKRGVLTVLVATATAGLLIGMAFPH